MSAREAWDERLKQHVGHLLQSWTWGSFKSRLGWQPERVMVENGDGLAMAQVLFRHAGPVSIGYVPRGPLLAGETGALWLALRREIDRRARRRRALCVIVEPDCASVAAPALADPKVAPAHESVQPARTVKVPLLDDDALLAQMHQKTRYNVRLASRRGVTIAPMEPSPENLEAFYALMRDTARRNSFSIHSRDYYAGVLQAFGEDAAQFGAWTEEGNLAASLIVALFGSEAIYLYGASSTVHRAHGAGLAIQFAAMQWARERGATAYDLWGIPREDPDATVDGDDRYITGSSGKDWRGLFRFKTGFGGEIIDYADPVERRYLPVLPTIVRNFGLIPG